MKRRKNVIQIGDISYFILNYNKKLLMIIEESLFNYGHYSCIARYAKYEIDQKNKKIRIAFKTRDNNKIKSIIQDSFQQLSLEVLEEREKENVDIFKLDVMKKTRSIYKWFLDRM